MNLRIIISSLLFSCLCSFTSVAETGYDLWLRYVPVEDAGLSRAYKKAHRNLIFDAPSSTTLTAAKDELERGLKGMIGECPTVGSIGSGSVLGPEKGSISDGSLVIVSADRAGGYIPYISLDECGTEGYRIISCKVKGKKVNVIAANSDKGILYGVFHYLRLMQSGQDISHLDILETPALTYRVLNHWDNLDGTIERGYAGYSLWDWERLPSHKQDRYIDYARANASIGINGVVLNNVNAKAKSLRRDWIVKASGLAEAFRPYGIRIYLTAKFSAPKEIGGLSTANPRDPEVRKWWKDKAREIYSIIPDFGGFLVKANSEGQPGPQDYGCTHAEGANILAEALEPYGGVVFWRAFVYQNERHIDRVVTGYNEFKPLDGKFNRNVFVQPKNGPIDFQPREPFHPLFGGMPDTPLCMEVQITQENLGHAGHLVYLGTLFEETLKSDTHADGEGSTVSKILRGYGKTHGMSAIAGVPNIGSDLNWTGHLFGQANWYAFGRMAWNPEISSGDVADEWIAMTFSTSPQVAAPIKQIMMMSRETYVDYTMPLGLNHIMNFASHNGPEPWHHDPSWTAYDYHRVTHDSIGVDRTHHGSGATRQYHAPLSDTFDSLETCPDEYLLWFHRLPFTYVMKSGRTLWDEMVTHYYSGVAGVREMQRLWAQLDGQIDRQRYNHVASLLEYQEREAIWWCDACVLFFQSYCGLPIPDGLEPPAHKLDYYKRIPFPHDWDGYYD